MTDLRSRVIEAATKALLDERWGNEYPDAVHGVRGKRGHHYDGACALCRADVGRIVPVVLDAADAALRASGCAHPEGRYVSTACRHAIADNRPDLHDDCRTICKFCDEPCQCEHHEEPPR